MTPDSKELLNFKHLHTFTFKTSRIVDRRHVGLARIKLYKAFGQLSRWLSISVRAAFVSCSCDPYLEHELLLRYIMFCMHSLHIFRPFAAAVPGLSRLIVIFVCGFAWPGYTSPKDAFKITIVSRDTRYLLFSCVPNNHFLFQT